jgi:hypothetical protein
MIKSFWQNISNISISATERSAELRKLRLINQMCFLAMLTTYLFVPFLVFIKHNYYTQVQFWAGTSCLFYLVLSKMRWHNASMAWIFVSILVNVFYCSLELPGGGVEYFLVPLGLIPFIIYDNVLVCVGSVAITSITFFASYFIKKTHIPFEAASAENIEYTFLLVLACVFTHCAIIIFQFKIANRKYEATIKKQKEVVEEKQKEILDSIHYARRIQNSLLPTQSYIQRKLSELKKK